MRKRLYEGSCPYIFLDKSAFFLYENINESSFLY
jgi:hypothetical protein